MYWQVKAEEERLDKAFLHHDLVEVREHIVNGRQVRHQHFESERFGHVHDRDMNLVWPPQVRSLMMFVSVA